MSEKYEELLRQKREIDREIKELENEIWGLDDLEENPLLQPPNLERN
jgi:cell division septum initiation protein DivIVA